TRAIRLTIPAKAEYITLGRLALTGLSRLRPLGEETLADLKLALTEACSNSVRHAYEGGQGAVEILYELHDDRLAIEVVDDAAGSLSRSRASASSTSRRRPSAVASRRSTTRSSRSCRMRAWTSSGGSSAARRSSSTSRRRSTTRSRARPRG